MKVLYRFTKPTTVGGKDYNTGTCGYFEEKNKPKNTVRVPEAEGGTPKPKAAPKDKGK